MGNFSTHIKSNDSKRKDSQQVDSKSQALQLKDNRLESSIQFQFSELVNSPKSNYPLQPYKSKNQVQFKSSGERLQMKSKEEDELQMKTIDEDELQMKTMEEDELQLKTIDEDELQMKTKEDDELQMKTIDEDELQMKTMQEDELQMRAMDEVTTQLKSENSLTESRLPFGTPPLQRQENNTGLPDQLKTGVESLSGYSLNDVKVHYNSAKPAQLNAHAYAQGNAIHLGPGQEKHLPHEAWHVVQQKQGRVKATRQLKGSVSINDDQGLEEEADKMGTKALQLKSKKSQSIQLKSSSQVIQRNEATDQTDARMNYLVHRVLAILKVLMKQGENWEEIYGNKGKDLVESGTQKAKESIFGTKKEKKGQSLKEKVIKEALKRWWGALSAEEKVKVVNDGVSVLGKIKSFVSPFIDFSGENNGNGKKQKEENLSKEDAWFKDLISAVELKDLEEVYGIYKNYEHVTKKIKEFETDVSDLAKEIGSSIGSGIGKIKTEREFIAKFKEQQAPLKVAKLEFAFLKESITDKSRYKSELNELEYALNPDIDGLYKLITNPDEFTEKGKMKQAVENCSISYTNLLAENIIRNASTSAISNIKNWILSKKEEYLGKSESGIKSTEEKQKKLVDKISEVCNKSWSKHTYGLFSFKPNGVKEIGEKLGGTKSSREKLIEIKDILTSPEKELVSTEKAIGSTDENIAKLSGNLKNDLTVDNLLSETRSEKNTEKYVGKQVDNSSDLAALGKEKIKLELKKKQLSNKIKGSNRSPLTQVFYNAIKGLQPDNEISLNITLTVMNQIGKELDNQELSKD